MKQGKSLITFVMAALAAALAIYFGYYVFDTFNAPYATTTAYAYTSNDSVEADGLLVRQEEVFPSQDGIVDVTRSEGEKVGVGQEVARVYRDSQAQSDQADLEALKLEIELLEYAAVQGGDVESAARLDEDILQSVVSLRASAALGDYADLEDQVLAVKSGVLKRGYTYGDGVTAADLTARLKDLKSQYASLKSQTASATSLVRASRAGVFSSLVDGYESRLTPETVFQLTAADLKTMMAGSGTQGGGIGKLITSDRWYFTASLPTDVAERLKKGGTATLRFTGDFAQDVDMRVDQIGAAEGDESLVVFSTDRYLNRTTLLRQQTAELIFDSWSGIRVPKEALRMDKYTYTETVVDEETGKEEKVEREASRLGVYVLLGGRVEFKTAEVVTEGSDYYVLRATSTESNALRAGDEVITRGVGLYDGQLLEF